MTTFHHPVKHRHGVCLFKRHCETRVGVTFVHCIFKVKILKCYQRTYPNVKSEYSVKFKTKRNDI